MRRGILIIIDSAIVILTVIAMLLIFGVLGGKASYVSENCFMFYTVDSNLLMALTSLLCLFFAARGKDVPEWLRVLRLSSTAALAFTFFTVVLFLGPRQGYGDMFSSFNLIMHLFTPVLAVVSFLLYPDHLGSNEKHWLWSLVPTVIYASVYYINVLVLGRWDDEYGFTSGGTWYISVLVTGAALIAITRALMALQKRKWRH